MNQLVELVQIGVKFVLTSASLLFAIGGLVSGRVEAVGLGYALLYTALFLTPYFAEKPS